MELTALRPENPVAVMAAYGALRLLPGARIRWAGSNPELHWDGDLVSALVDRLPERRAAPEVTALNDPRDKNIGGVAGYRQLAGKIPHEWLTAMSVETAESIVPTRLLLFSGNHKFVAAARDLLDALAKHHVEDRVREALVGPWRYDTKAQAWGWDAASRDDTAAMAAAPSASKKPGVPGAYWLAWESLPEEKEEIPGLDDLQPRDLLDLNRVGDVALGGAVMALRENTGKLDQGLLDRFDEISDDFVTKGANAALKQAMPFIERGLEQMCDVVRNGFHDEKKACLAGNDQSSIRGRAPVEIAGCPQRAQPGFLISLASGKYASGSSADFGVPHGLASRRTVSSRLTGVEALTISRLGSGTAC